MLSYDLSILLGFGMFLALYLRNTDELVKKLYSKIDDLSEKLNNERTEREKLSGSVETLSSSIAVPYKTNFCTSSCKVKVQHVLH